MSTKRYVVCTITYKVVEHTFARETPLFVITRDSDGHETRWKKGLAATKVHFTWGAAHAELLSRIDYNIQYYQEQIDKLTRTRGNVLAMSHPPIDTN